LISERLGQHDIAIEALEHATRRLETEFESSESQEVEHKYTVALVNLGRVRLASGAQAQALAVFADALELAGEDARMVVQCHLGQALAQAGLGEADKALEEFQQALNACDSLGTAEDAVSFKEEVSVLLTRTLWSMQDEDAKEAAQAHLLERYVPLISWIYSRTDA
jgi:superkiller protein 3